MVREHVTLLDIGDIRCMRVRCGNPECNQEHLIQLLGKRESCLPPRCPQCGMSWYTRGSSQVPPELRLLKALKEPHAGAESPMTIRLESADD